MPAGVQVYTVSLGVQSDQQLLQDIAATTGGVFHAVHSAADVAALHEIYAHLQALTGGEEVIAAGSDTVFGIGRGGGYGGWAGPDRPTRASDALSTDLASSLVGGAALDVAPEFLTRLRPAQTHRVPIDGSVEEVTFFVSWHDTERGVTLGAIAPSARRVDAGTADSAGGGTSWAFLRVRTPEPGTWRIVVRARASRGMWWGRHPYTWSCSGATEIGLRVKVPRVTPGVSELPFAVGLQHRDQATAPRFKVAVDAPAMAIDELIDRHASELRDIELRIRPDTPQSDPNVYKLAVLDAQLRQRGGTVFTTTGQELQLDESTGNEGRIDSGVAGLYTLRVTAQDKTRDGHAPVPPILVGGNAEVAIRRAATYGDGWYPSQIAPHTLAVGAAKLRELATDRGRAAPAVHVGGLTIQSDQESVRAARAARASFVRGLPGDHGISPEEAMATVTASPEEAAEQFAAYAGAGAGADSISISPGIGSVDQEWMRQCELVAHARAMLA